jgi:hypothetical protein
MALVFYVVGFIVLIAGLAWAATLLGLPSTWILVGVMILAGIAILSIASNVRRGPPPPGPPPPPGY